MEGPGGAGLLRELFRSAPPGQSVVLRRLRPGGVTLTTPAEEPEVPDEADLKVGEWFFGTMPRGHNGAVELGTCVWADFDGNAPDKPYPTCTATVLSGRPGGLHCYWVLAQPVDAGRTVRLARLAALAQQSDPAVAEPSRIMRLPGSYNNKPELTVPVLCQLETFRPEVFYDAAELEEYLVALLLSRWWDSGQRHDLALGLGATLARANWDEDRVDRVARLVCDRTGDPDVKDRTVAARNSVVRHQNGDRVSASALRDAMGQDYRALLTCLGVTANDGDVLFEDQRIGNVATLERDVAAWVLGLGDWAYADGRLHRWEGRFYRPSSDKELRSAIFSLLAGLKTVTAGLEHDFNATAKLGREVAGTLEGWLMADPVADPAPWYLPLRNGVLDLRNLELLPHSKELGSRWLLDLDYDPDATCPVWEAFVASAVSDEVGGLLQDWVGYCLEAGNPLQYMLWLYGRTQTGKSTFLSALAALFGPATSAVTAGTFTEYVLAEISGKRVVLCSEIPDRTLRTTTLKAVVSGDDVQARHIYGRPFTTRFGGKVVWASNSQPPVDQGEGTFRRILMVPFERQPSVPDPSLSAKIRLELPGLLNWALVGLGRAREYVQAGRWPVPQEVLDLLKEYREAANPWEQFKQDCLDLDDDGVVPIDDLYRAYKAWATDHGVRPEPWGPIFRQEMKRVGGWPAEKPEKVGKKWQRVWRGVILREQSFLSQPEEDDDAG